MKEGYHNSVEKAPFKPRDSAASTAPLLEDSGPSKSKRKRDMHALQSLGVKLVALPSHQLAELALPEALREAIELAQRITSREGRRRQLQYIGKLMRKFDAGPLQQAFERLGDVDRQATALLHAAEHWRQRLLTEPAALALWMQRHTGTDAQALALLLEQARTELAAGKPGRYGRELFRMLRAGLAGAVQPSPL